MKLWQKISLVCICVLIGIVTFCCTLLLSQQAIFVFRGRGSPKPKIRQWVLAGCACYRIPSFGYLLY